MKVTDEMVERAGAAYVDSSDRQLSSALRLALEAALADVSEPVDTKAGELAVYDLAALRAEVKKLAEEWRTLGRKLVRSPNGLAVTHAMGATLIDSAEILTRRLLGDAT